MTIPWRSGLLILLPLLFVSVSCHDNLHFYDVAFGDGGEDAPSARNGGGNVQSENNREVHQVVQGVDGRQDDGGSVLTKNNKDQTQEPQVNVNNNVDDYDMTVNGDEINSELKAQGLALGSKVVIQTTTYKGKWEIFSPNSGVSAMHLIILPKVDKALMFDATVWLISRLTLPPPCRHVEDPKAGVKEDCFAHSVLMDIHTAEIRPLRLQYDTWCSSGALDTNGRLVSTGGYNNGSDTVRILDICPTCEWKEYPGSLAKGRWYSTQVTLADGRFMVFGGRSATSYEFVPPEGKKNTPEQLYQFQFLIDTFDPVENNLYPFVYLSTDGNLFIFANDRSILLNPNTHQIVHQFPVLPGGARNYPASGCSCLLPIRLQPKETRQVIPAEVLICGGAPKDAFHWSDLVKPKVFVEANKDCARLDITKRNGKWKIQTMPSPRVLGDAIILPTGDVLIVNGAMKGSAGWDDARDPNFTPLLYHTRGGNQLGSKFTELTPAEIPRMYHSTTALLPDASVLVAGSNTNAGYQDNVLFPTETRVEKFYPHYFDPNLQNLRVKVMTQPNNDWQIRYGESFSVEIEYYGPPVDLSQPQDTNNVEVLMYYPPFTTHGISMNQRMIQLGIVSVTRGNGPNAYNFQVDAPKSGNIAPPGYYMLFVTFKTIPCISAPWIQLLP